MTYALLRQQRQGGVVVQVELAAFLGEHATMAVVGVFAETLVGNQIGLIAKGVAQSFQGFLDDPIIVQRARSGGVLGCRNAEQNERPQPKPNCLAHLVH